MKKILIIAAFAFVCLNSCKKEGAIPEVSNHVPEVSKQGNMDQSKMLAAQTPALIIDQHLDNPGPHELINQCTGEAITFTGNIGDDIHIVINGNRMNLSEHIQGHTTGIGSLGNTYISDLNENVAFNETAFNGLFIIEDILIVTAISTNGTPNLTYRRNAHLTVTANGVVTVDKIDFDVLCHG